jgi:hypothetical protein
MSLSVVLPLPSTVTDSTNASTSRVDDRVVRRELVTPLTVSLLCVVATVLLRWSYRLQVIRTHAMGVCASWPNVIERETIRNRANPQFVSITMCSDGLGFTVKAEGEVSVSFASFVDLTGPQPTRFSFVDLADEQLITSQTVRCQWTGAQRISPSSPLGVMRFAPSVTVNRFFASVDEAGFLHPCTVA